MIKEGIDYQILYDDYHHNLKEMRRLQNEEEMSYDEAANLVVQKDIARIMLTSGDFCGTIYHYTTVSFEEVKDGDAVLQFGYSITESPTFDVELLSVEDKVKFETLIGDVLADVIERSVDES